MPNPDRITEKVPPARNADTATIYKVWNPQKPNGPYHLINTNLVLVDSGDRTRRLRGGDNFILSPLFCGSAATGWSLSTRFLGGKMNLATAMAVSGAAANPSTGAGGKGITRNKAVSILMSVLGLSLGYWVPHPNDPLHKWRRPNHFRPGLYAISPRGYTGAYDRGRNHRYAYR